MRELTDTSIGEYLSTVNVSTKNKQKAALTAFRNWRTDQKIQDTPITSEQIERFKSVNPSNWEEQTLGTYCGYVYTFAGLERPKKHRQTKSKEEANTMEDKTLSRTEPEEHGAEAEAKEAMTDEAEAGVKELPTEAEAEQEESIISDVADESGSGHAEMYRRKTRKKRGVNRVQISVYLPQNVYDILDALSRVNGGAVSDIVEDTAINFAEKNREIAKSVIKSLSSYRLQY
ncbi:MAG: hypothetical protein IJM47_04125 [Synergistaceae bacterium]|nr:hypothetical protein [Synergistaceae bacterium]